MASAFSINFVEYLRGVFTQSAVIRHWLINFRKWIIMKNLMALIIVLAFYFCLSITNFVGQFAYGRGIVAFKKETVSSAYGKGRENRDSDHLEGYKGDGSIFHFTLLVKK